MSMGQYILWNQVSDPDQQYWQRAETVATVAEFSMLMEQMHNAAKGRWSQKKVSGSERMLDKDIKMATYLFIAESSGDLKPITDFSGVRR
jgi:hypothetical protein